MDICNPKAYVAGLLGGYMISIGEGSGQWKRKKGVAYRNSHSLDETQQLKLLLPNATSLAPCRILKVFFLRFCFVHALMATERRTRAARDHCSQDIYIPRFRSDLYPPLNVRSTNFQIPNLVDYMSTLTAFARGDFTGPLGQKKNDLEWANLKALVAERGPDKSVDQWKNTWRDLKKKLETGSSGQDTAVSLPIELHSSGHSSTMNPAPASFDPIPNTYTECQKSDKETTGCVRHWLYAQSDVTIIDWPAKNPDLNPNKKSCGLISMVWNHSDVRNSENLNNVVMSTWQNMRGLHANTIKMSVANLVTPAHPGLPPLGTPVPLTPLTHLARAGERLAPGCIIMFHDHEHEYPILGLTYHIRVFINN
ncbi:hypothetical protein EVAR_7368_1 [Eumeta japonica]|uniref:Regulatory protein zeste n=1 Tax=Eumeta variegata TaxID=151549 RepID=A0A4C1V7L5_EUMVA|nr:hypothetical protein EVAR_7368_1 [Eumeta japonica]